MMRALEVKESSVRQAGAWIGEKLGRFKLRPEGEGRVIPDYFLRSKPWCLALRESALSGLR